MKIARVGFEDCGLFRSLVVEDLSDGLNVILGETGSGKSTLRNGLGGLLFGFESIGGSQLPNGFQKTSAGDLMATIGSESYRLRRRADQKAAPQDALVAASIHAGNRPLARQIGEITPGDYFTFFNVSFVDAPAIERRMSQSLLSRFSPGRSTPWSSEAEYLRWREEATRRRDRLSEDETQYQRLQSRAERLKGELADAERHHRQRLTELEHHRDQARKSLLGLESEFTNWQQRLRELEAELHAVENQRRTFRPTPVTTLPNTAQAVGVQRICGQLDFIQKEIRRTSAVLRDIRKRCETIDESRLRLSDGEPSFEHWRIRGLRRHLARLEQNLESVAGRLGESYEIARLPDWAKAELAIGTSFDSATLQEWRWPTDEQLFPLEVSELRMQYRESRQDTGEAWHWVRVDVEALRRELDRYLLEARRERWRFERTEQRRCARELRRRLLWLRRRRRQRLAELRHWDAAGYELLRQGEQRFLKYARKHGFWEARRHFLGELKLPLQIEYTTEDPALEKRLQELRLEIARVQQRLSDLNPATQEARRVWQSLVDQYEQLNRTLNLESLRRELLDVQREAESLEARLIRLRDEVRRDDPLWNLRYDNIADQASVWCRRLTQGKLTRVLLDRERQSLVALDANNAQHTFSVLSRDLQDLVCLSFCLAVTQRQYDNGHPLPLVLDDLFANLDVQSTQTVLETLWEFANLGHQVLLLASERQVGQRWLERVGISLDSTRLSVYQLPVVHNSQTREQVSVVLRPLLTTKVEVPQVSPPVEVQRVWPLITEQTPLAHLDLIEPEWLLVLSKHRILVIGDLLDLDPQDLPQSLRMHGVTVGQMDRWQSQTWLLCCIPGLRTYDVRLLVGSGITEPEELDELSAGDVLRRLEIYLATEEGQRVMHSGTADERARLHAWMNSLRNNRQTWAAPRSSEWAGTRRQRWQRVRGGRMARTPVAHESGPSPQRDTTSQRDSVTATTTRLNGSTAGHAETSDSRLAFYLNLDDTLERAPSIGPRMAERFAEIGVSNVRQFLNAPLEEMVRKLKLRRLDAQTLADWQRQAKLVCRIPNLRGHDAQLLVACGIHDPESLLSNSATELLAKVSPIAQSKEGQRILRSSPEPDLAEINDWISWAKHHRALH